MEARERTRLLVVRVGAFGDVLHGMPAVAALRTRLPEIEVGWAVDERWAPLVLGVTDHVHRVPTRLWKRRPLSAETLGSIRHLRREMRAVHYDVCVDLQGTLRSAVIARLSGARRVVGPASPRESVASWAYSERVELRGPNVIRQACELLSAAVDQRLTPAAVTIPQDLAAEAWAAERVSDEAFALLVPGAGWGAKQWPAANFMELARELKTWGLRVLINASQEDDPLAREIAEATPCGRMVCSVAQLIALTRRAALVVGGDTGPMHLAAALGRPTVALFGPTDPLRNGPHFAGARVRICRHPESVRSYKRTAETDSGLKRLTVHEVLEAAEEVMRNGNG